MSHAAKTIKPAENLLGRKKKRVWELDFIRGICILLMVFDHLMFNFAWLVPQAVNFNAVKHPFFTQMARFSFDYWEGTLRMVVRSIVVFLFLFLSGISCAFTRSNAGRLRKMAIAAGLVTIVTYSVDAVANLGISIAFGILHILAFSLLLYMVMKLFCPRREFYMAVGALLIIGGLYLPHGNGTIPFWRWLEFGSVGSRLDWDGFVQVFMGIASFGGDSYGIFPYTGFFLFGAGVAEVLYPEKRSLLPKLDGAWNRAYTFVGRHGIIIYLAHQVIVVAAVVLAAMAVGYRFF